MEVTLSGPPKTSTHNKYGQVNKSKNVTLASLSCRELSKCLVQVHKIVQETVRLLCTHTVGVSLHYTWRICCDISSECLRWCLWFV